MVRVMIWFQSSGTRAAGFRSSWAMIGTRANCMPKVRGLKIVMNHNECSKGSCHGTFQKATEYRSHWPVKQRRKGIDLMKTSAQQPQDYPPKQLSTFWTSCDQEKCCTMQQLQWYCRQQDGDISDWYCKKTVNLLVESHKELRQCFRWPRHE